MTNDGNATLGHGGENLPQGRLLTGEQIWQAAGLGCFPQEGGSISCAAGNGHGFYMGRSVNQGANPY